MNDPRYAQGTECTWHDSIEKAVKRGGMWHCPSCRGSLQVFATEAEFWEYFQRLHPTALAQAKARWGKGKCYSRQDDTFEDAYALDHAELEVQA